MVDPSSQPAFVQAIGMMAGILTTIAFLPQVIKAWTTRSVGDVSLVMFLVLVTGISLWLTYGLLIGDLPLVLANGVTFVLAGAILIMKLIWDGPWAKKRSPEEPNG